MKNKILTVEGTFLVETRGVIVSGLLEAGTERFDVGDLINILRPDNTSISTVVKGWHMFGGCISGKKNMGMLLGTTTKEDVPIGSLILLIDVE
jgi:translation elongation factor EF-Tu-like GTPase